MKWDVKDETLCLFRYWYLHGYRSFNVFLFQLLFRIHDKDETKREDIVYG